MNSPEHLKQRRIFFYATLVLLLLLAGAIILPFFRALITAGVLAILFYPVYVFINKYVKRSNISALLVVVIALLVIFLPFIIVFNQLLQESNIAYVGLRRAILATQRECEEPTKLCEFINEVKDYLNDPKIRFYLEDSLEKVRQYAITQAGKLIVALPFLIVNLFILLISMFFFLRDGPKLILKLEQLLPLRKESAQRIFLQFANMSKAIVYGYVVTALIQGVIALIGFYAINWIFSPEQPLIGAPFLWASLLALLSMIPVLGSGLVWGPIAVVLIVQGYLGGNNASIQAGVSLFFYGLIIISNIDNILRPIISGKKARVHSLVIILGIIGGLAVFGLTGVVLGPLILALLITYLKIYEEGRI